MGADGGVPGGGAAAGMVLDRLFKIEQSVMEIKDRLLMVARCPISPHTSSTGSPVHLDSSSKWRNCPLGLRLSLPCSDLPLFLSFSSPSIVI